MPETIQQDYYQFNFRLAYIDYPQDFKDNHPINNFLFYYDFSKKQGNITFSAPFEELIDYFEIDFPKLVPNDKVTVQVKKCLRGDTDCKEPVTDIHPTIDFSEQPKLSPSHTQVTISNFTRPLDNERVIVTFEMNMYPSGIFDFDHNFNKINQNLPKGAVNFVLGYKYTLYSLDDINGHMVETTQSDVTSGDIKLEFKEHDSITQHRIKLLSLRSNKTPPFIVKLNLKDLLFGLGVSLFSSVIVLFFTLNRDSKRIKL